MDGRRFLPVDGRRGVRGEEAGLMVRPQLPKLDLPRLKTAPAVSGRLGLDAEDNLRPKVPVFDRLIRFLDGDGISVSSYGFTCF